MCLKCKCQKVKTTPRSHSQTSIPDILTSTIPPCSEPLTPKTINVNLSLFRAFSQPDEHLFTILLSQTMSRQVEWPCQLALQDVVPQEPPTSHTRTWPDFLVGIHERGCVTSNIVKGPAVKVFISLLLLIIFLCELNGCIHIQTNPSLSWIIIPTQAFRYL